MWPRTYVHDSLEYGAIGYLMKDRPADDLVDAIRAVACGIVQIDGAVAGKLLHTPIEPDRRTTELRNHISNLYGKLDIHDRLELVRYIHQIRRFLGSRPRR